MGMQQEVNDKVKEALRKEDPKKSQAAALKGARFWVKIFNSLCPKCKHKAYDITMKSLQRNMPNQFNPRRDLCEACQENVKLNID